MTKKHATAGNNAEWSKSTGAGQFSGDVIFFSSVALASHAREKDRSFGPDRSPDGKYFPSKIIHLLFQKKKLFIY
jgi:hypothetical protein